MATLNGGITSTAELIRVTGTPPSSGAYFTIGSEAIRFLGASRGPGGRSFTRDYWQVERGVAGTTKATHSNGATLTPYYPDAPGGGGGSISATDGTTTVDPATSIVFPMGTLADLGGGVAGVGLILSRIGPFPIAFDDAALFSSEMELAPLEEGAVVLRAYSMPGVRWTKAGATAYAVGDFILNIGIGSAAAGTVGCLRDSDFANREAAAVSFANAELIGPDPNHLSAWVGQVLEPGQFLCADIQNFDGGPATAGSSEIYAIIATPAS